MIGRQLIDALARREDAPWLHGPLPEPFVPLYAEDEAAAPEPAAPEPQLKPPRILGYAVARYDGPRAVLTHTSLMAADEARREADAQRAVDRTGYGWAVVEIRRVMPP